MKNFLTSTLDGAFGSPQRLRLTGDRRIQRSIGMGLILTGLLSLSACSLLPREAVDRHANGWRPGVVQRVGTAEQLGQPLQHDCRSSEPADSKETFALVDYPHGCTWRNAIGVVAPGTTLTEGEEVWVPASDCRPIEPK